MNRLDRFLATWWHRLFGDGVFAIWMAAVLALPIGLYLLLSFLLWHAQQKAPRP